MEIANQPFLNSTISETQSCQVLFNTIANIEQFLIENAPRIGIIIDENVSNLWGALINQIISEGSIELLFTVTVNEGESCKNVNEYLRVIDQLQAHALNRRDTLVVIGGGACCDMGGFVAATFMRGLPYVLIPTTLMAMVDAALGGKVAINLHSGKNLLGAFHMPTAVLIDTAFLKTLPLREMRQAFGEIVKIATISEDPTFFNNLESFSIKAAEMLAYEESLNYMIEYSIRKKLHLVEKDWKEQNLNRLLNAGHAIAHTLEKVFDFDQKRLAHGEAVAIGLSACARFSREKGVIPTEDYMRIIELITKLGLPNSIRLSKSEYKKTVNAFTIQTRVRNGNLRLVLPKSTCESFIYQEHDAADVINCLAPC